MALDTGGWFPHGPGHDVEAGHEDDVARGLEAHDALLLAFVLDGSARLFLRYFSRRGGESLGKLGEFGRVAPRRSDVEIAQLLDERSARGLRTFMVFTLTTRPSLSSSTKTRSPSKPPTFPHWPFRDVSPVKPWSWTLIVPRRGPV